LLFDNLGSCLVYLIKFIELNKHEACETRQFLVSVVQKTTKKATREYTKILNSNLVLKTIYAQGQISRADISRTTKLTPATVSTIVSGLINEGLVAETGTVPIKRGKPPTQLVVVENAYSIIGINLARSTFYGASMDLRGNITHLESIPLYENTGDEALSLVYKLIDSLLATCKEPVLGISVGAPGIVDGNNGAIRFAANVDWQDLPLQELLRDRYALPVYVVNDNDASVMAEYTFGRYKNSPDLVVFHIGQGIGAGIVLHHQLLRGHGSGAGEIGHVTVVEEGERCLCGNYGCLETVASSRAIVAKAREIARDNHNSMLHRYATATEQIDIGAIQQALENGDETLYPLLRDVGHYIGIALASVVGLLSVPYILMTGSVSQLGQPLFEIIEREIATRTLTFQVSETKIEPASFDSDTVLLGTAALLLKHELGVF
jgi:N-acetylglucosamine repressor